MKFFFPDSQDLVDPSFDFVNETRSPNRVRQRDDQYAHEVFSAPPYDGMLVSKAVVDGVGGGSGRYTLGQRRRFYFEGVRKFLRLRNSPIEIMGDNGAFTYVNEEVPPVTVDEVISFYDDCGFDYGFSVDHMILGYNEDADHTLPSIDIVPPDWRRRQEITFELGRAFIKQCKQRKTQFQPIGVAQGWSPKSYAHSVKTMQKIGFSYIALGGMVALKTEEILACLEAIATVRKPENRLHLLGVSRIQNLRNFDRLGVYSFDSTSPLQQAFKEDLNNYYGKEYRYSAIRIPQVDANRSLRNLIQSGEVRQEEARRLELACLTAVINFDKRKGRRTELVSLLREYQELYGSKRDYSDRYDHLLTDKPWKKCPCAICKRLGIHVVIFRGAERNRRRGFHNIYATYSELQVRRKQLSA